MRTYRHQGVKPARDSQSIGVWAKDSEAGGSARRCTAQAALGAPALAREYSFLSFLSLL